jgi:hypothetical protein
LNKMTEQWGKSISTLLTTLKQVRNLDYLSYFFPLPPLYSHYLLTTEASVIYLLLLLHLKNKMLFWRSPMTFWKQLSDYKTTVCSLQKIWEPHNFKGKSLPVSCHPNIYCQPFMYT